MDRSTVCDHCLAPLWGMTLCSDERECNRRAIAQDSAAEDHFDRY